MTGPKAPPGDAAATVEAQSRLLLTRARLRRYAKLLDSGIGVPGTRWQIGVESLIGLIPGVGDLAGALIGSWFIFEAYRLRVPGSLLARMTGNVVFDAVLGVVPVVGDVADFVFKSNRRNLRLLDAHLDAHLNAPFGPPPPRRRRRRVGLALGGLLLLIAAYLLWRLGGFTA